MKPVSAFFERFKNLRPPNDSIKTAIVSSLKDTLNISVSNKQVSIAHGVAYIKTSSVAKSAIQVNRAKVLEHLFQNIPTARDTIRDIR